MKVLTISKSDRIRLNTIREQVLCIKGSLYYLQDNNRAGTLESLRVILRQYNTEQCEILNRSWK